MFPFVGSGITKIMTIDFAHCVGQVFVCQKRWHIISHQHIHDVIFLVVCPVTFPSTAAYISSLVVHAPVSLSPYPSCHCLRLSSDSYV